MAAEFNSKEVMAIIDALQKVYRETALIKITNGNIVRPGYDKLVDEMIKEIVPKKHKAWRDVIAKALYERYSEEELADELASNFFDLLTGVRTNRIKPYTPYESGMRMIYNIAAGQLDIIETKINKILKKYDRDIRLTIEYNYRQLKKGSK